MTTLEAALRGATQLGKLNLFRNRGRGCWDASAARIGSDSSFSVGSSDDPVEALLKALAASAAGAQAEASKPVVPPVAPDLPNVSVDRGIFG